MSEPSIGALSPQTVRALLDALRGLRFGSVEVVVHDGRISRIERKERWRLEPDPTAERSEANPNETTRKRPDRRSSPDSSREESQ